LDPKIAPLSKEFVLVRLTSLRGANLDVFEFDYDLTWMAFFLSADERVLGRFGSRMPEDANKYRTIEALQFAMQAALKRHQQGPATKPPARPPRTVDDYPGIARFGATACAHCHHAYDLRREMLQEKETWTLDEVWVYPPPENVGWTMAVTPGNRLEGVVAKSPADAAGMRAGDILVQVNGEGIATFSDVQHALHKAPPVGELHVRWSRDDKSMAAMLKLAPGWRRSDVSWRRSVKGLEPGSGLNGEDLTAKEKKELGLAPKALAFRQGNFPSKQARQAGVLQNDIIVGIDGKQPEFTVQQFDTHIRLSYRKGDTVRLDVLRDGKKLELRMKLGL
jgi:serine protease Do